MRGRARRDRSFPQLRGSADFSAEADGEPVMQAAAMSAGQAISIHFSDGDVGAVIDDGDGDPFDDDGDGETLIAGQSSQPLSRVLEPHGPSKVKVTL